MSFSQPDIPQPVLPAAPPPPVLGAGPQGTKPKRKSMQPTMLGGGLSEGASLTNTNPGKSLLGE